jgi:hypothetical protein
MPQHHAIPDLRLPERYDAALGEAVAYIHEHYAPTGIVVAGSIIRGVPDPTSDFDIVVAHEPPWRQRAQRLFRGVPAEIFVNPPFQIRRAFAQEAAEFRPILAHMMATGVILHDPDGLMADLAQGARDSMDTVPPMSAEQETSARYMIATQFEDAEDVRERDPDRAAAMLVKAVIDAARLRFRQAGRWLPREKELFTALDDLDPALGALVRQVMRATTLDARFAAAQPIVAQVAGATGFFPWDSDPQPLTPDGPS